MFAANSAIMQYKQTYLHFVVKMQIFKDQSTWYLQLPLCFQALDTETYIVDSHSVGHHISHISLHPPYSSFSHPKMSMPVYF
jgi:hypothetical protein